MGAMKFFFFYLFYEGGSHEAYHNVSISIHHVSFFPYTRNFLFSLIKKSVMEKDKKKVLLTGAPETLVKESKKEKIKLKNTLFLLLRN